MYKLFCPWLEIPRANQVVAPSSKPTQIAFGVNQKKKNIFQVFIPFKISRLFLAAGSLISDLLLQVSEMLTLPPDLVRYYRDDITITVVFFDTDYIKQHEQ